MSTTTKPNRKTYDLEFKKQAVQLLHRSGQPLAQFACELGVLALAVARREEAPQLRHQRDILKNFGDRFDHMTDRYQRIQVMELEHP